MDINKAIQNNKINDTPENAEEEKLNAEDQNLTNAQKIDEERGKNRFYTEPEIR